MPTHSNPRRHAQTDHTPDADADAVLKYTTPMGRGHDEPWRVADGVQVAMDEASQAQGAGAGSGGDKQYYGGGGGGGYGGGGYPYGGYGGYGYPGFYSESMNGLCLKAGLCGIFSFTLPNQSNPINPIHSRRVRWLLHQGPQRRGILRQSRWERRVRQLLWRWRVSWILRRRQRRRVRRRGLWLWWWIRLPPPAARGASCWGVRLIEL
jgi:hypothetical protein